jgi:6-phosphogluconolactonase
MPQIYSYATSSQVADALARQIVEIQDAALSSKDHFDIAISGGSLGKVLKAGLIDNKAIAEKVHWEKWRVFFADERLVPLDHEDSNYGLFNSLVLKELAHEGHPGPTVFAINETLLHETDTTTDEAIAKEYESFLPESLDLVLLGAGPDGHTASLFPGHKLLKEESVKIATIDDSPKPPSRRITITFPVLRASKNISFVAEGAGKAPIFKEIFGAEKSGLPAELVNELPVPVSWFTNDEALQGVPVTPSKY